LIREKRAQRAKRALRCGRSERFVALVGFATLNATGFWQDALRVDTSWAIENFENLQIEAH